MVYGGGLTIWQGSAFECNNQQNTITLRHSEYATGTMGDCNDRAIVASSVGVSANCYTSILNITVGQEMANKTIECVHRDILGEISLIGQKVLRITKGNVVIIIIIIERILINFFFVYQDSYELPSIIQFKRLEKNQLEFSWNQATNISQCPSTQYIITTRNCGNCPNTTTDTTVVCTSVNASDSANGTCMFAVQKEVCGHLLGNRSEYFVVNLTEYILHGENANLIHLN